MAKHFYGARKDKKDYRDYRYVKRMAGVVPSAVDLRSITSPVRDQGQLGSCTGFAIATGMREFLENMVKEPFVEMSPLYLYYEERVIEGSVSDDAGAEPRDGMKVLASLGCAPEADDPYDVNKFTQAPSTQAVTDAANYKVLSYHSLNIVIGDAKDCLSAGSGFVIGFDVYDSFESDAVAATGDMPMPQPGEQVLGGHATFVVGYKDDASWPGGGYLIVKNSWNTDWGDKGYFYMPYAYFTAAYVSDAWVALPIAPTPPTPAAPPTISSFTPTLGPTGTSIAIVGTNFGGVTDVKIGTISAAFTANSDTLISAVVPQLAVTGKLSVTTPGGTVTTTTAFTVTLAPPIAPTIATFTPTSGPVGTLVTLTGTDFGKSVSVLFNGLSAKFTIASDKKLTATVPSAATTGPITIVTPDGNVSTNVSFVVPAVPPVPPVPPTPVPPEPEWIKELMALLVKLLAWLEAHYPAQHRR